MIQDGEVKIVDEFTGRIMEGRRWSEGLHQAIEAKENVPIQEEHQTLATITLQNYFRLYEKLAGMTGTAKTEEKEFVEIYNLNVVEIPTNVAVARDDQNDLIFKTVEAKFDAVVNDVKERNEKGQPVLVGTIAVETSEYLSELLKRQGVPHTVLNAKEHAREAEIIKDAGNRGSVTIATNMAGRGVDIKIDDEVRALGGLYVLGTERHEARRIDNQLRGRSGRQGDPGATRFYLSGRDDLVRLFAGDRIHGIMERFKLPDDQPMEAGILSRQIENAQKKVEEQNFVMRKNVLKYDDVMNVQRQVIYEQRNSVLHGADLSEEIREEWLPEVISNVVSDYTATELSEDWELGDLVAAMGTLYGTGVAAEELKGLERDQVVQEFLDDALDAYAEREKDIEALEEGLMRQLERFIILQVVDIALARAPREHGLHARGHRPARARAEGPARRVPERRRDDVPGPEPRHPRGSDHAPVPRRGERTGERRAPAAGPERCQRCALVRAPVARRLRGDPRGRRHVDRGSRVRERRRGRDTRRPPPEGEQRVRECRPERPLPVRLRQEVQEVPRGLTRPEPALADDAISLEPLAESLAPELGWVLAGDADTARFTRIPAHPDHTFLAAWLGRYEQGWDSGSSAGFAIRDRATAGRDRLRRVRPPRPRAGAG